MKILTFALFRVITENSKNRNGLVMKWLKKEKEIKQYNY